MRTIPGNETIRKGRLHKARQFFDAAEVVREFADAESDVGDAFVTLCVHAGIAAADAICIRELGEFANGQNHREAVNLLKLAAGAAPSKSLDTLLGMKTLSGYSHTASTSENRKKAKRAAELLIDAAK